MSDLTPDFIGQGLAWPLRVDDRGGIAVSGGVQDIESSIRVILTTAPGERLMRPQFGCRIWEQLFDPINPNTLGLMANSVRQALAQWEPRATVDEVVVQPDAGESGRVNIQITYTVRTTNDRRNLVYPFYVIPREGEE